MNETISTGFRQVFTFAFITLFTFATVVPAQKANRGVTNTGSDTLTVMARLEGGGIVVDGNPSCATLNASNNAAFAHITENWGLKLDFSPPQGISGPYPFTNGGGRTLTGGAPAEPTNSIALNRDDDTFDFTSTRPITAVIVKGGPDGNVYVYPLEALADQDLTTPGNGSFGISHIEFCYQLTGGATAAPVNLGGRVTSAVGRAVYNAEVTLMDMNTGEIRTTRTNTFGHYTFDNVDVTAFYALSVSAKKHNFRNATQYFTLSEDRFDMDFVAN